MTLTSSFGLKTIWEKNKEEKNKYDAAEEEGLHEVCGGGHPEVHSGVTPGRTLLC